MPRSKATSTTDRRRPRTAATTFRFVGGKGGVGKTTCAAARGLLAARSVARTLVVSTDPAPSLGDALRQTLTGRPQRVRGIPGLEAVEIDATAAIAAWLDDRRGLLEQIALRGTWLDADDVSRLLRLSLPGIDEVAALLKLAEFAASGRYDHIIVDTAPTGHLLRMLGMPAILEGLAQVFDRMQSKHRIMVDALRGGWEPDAADALIHAIDDQAGWLAALLRDPARCRVSWVTLAEDMAIEETNDALRALHAERLVVDRVIVNRMTAPPPGRCDWCQGRLRLEHRALLALRRQVRGRDLTIALVPAIPAEPRGTRALSGIARCLSAPAPEPVIRARPARRIVAAMGPPARVIDRRVLLPEGTALVLFGGKGGVGKTTCAAALAIDAASSSRDRRVLLLSADPAHSLGDVLGMDLADKSRSIPGGPANLALRELDARRGFAALRDRFARGVDEVVQRIGAGGADRQVLHDLFELAPPGVDELVAIIEVIEALDSRAGPTAFDLVVIDTAPTGHALRLLEMPALVHDWVRAVMAILLKYQPVIGMGDLGSVLLQLSRGLGELRALLADPARTRFVAVTRPAALPRAETVRLLARLDAAGIAAPVVLVNAVGAGTCGRCRTDHARHAKEVAALRRELGHVTPRRSLVLAPATIPPPSGWRDLRRFFREWRHLGGVRR